MSSCSCMFHCAETSTRRVQSTGVKPGGLLHLKVARLPQRCRCIIDEHFAHCCSFCPRCMRNSWRLICRACMEKAVMSRAAVTSAALRHEMWITHDYIHVGCVSKQCNPVQIYGLYDEDMNVACGEHVQHTKATHTYSSDLDLDWQRNSIAAKLKAFVILCPSQYPLMSNKSLRRRPCKHFRCIIIPRWNNESQSSSAERVIKFFFPHSLLNKLV